MTPLQEEAIKALLCDWIRVRCSLIWDRSYSVSDDLCDLYADAQHRAEMLGIEWSDDYFEQHNLDVIKACS